MSSPFVVHEHVFAGQHIREYPKALAAGQEDVVRLHAHAYTPREVYGGRATGQLTIIAYTANGFGKETYEPFFEALYQCLKNAHGLLVNGIWIADQAAQGHSALLNDDILGNDPSWFDHSRDILTMINTFRTHMKRPIVAVGHSMGAAQAVGTAHLHPRVFETMALIDPSMAPTYATTLPQILKFTLSKPETFASHEEAEAWVRKTAFFKPWDPRVVQRYIDTAFHMRPTASVPEQKVKLLTTNSVEAVTLARPNTKHIGVAGPLSEAERAEYPNLDPQAPLTAPIYNPHTRMSWTMLPTLRPSALFLLGKGSRITQPKDLEERTNLTGTAPGGSGGAIAGRVQAITIPGGHFLPFTNPDQTAVETGKWLAKEVGRFHESEELLAREWQSKDLAEKQKLTAETAAILKKWDGKPWSKPRIEDVKSKL